MALKFAMCIHPTQTYPAMVCPDAEAAHQAQAEWLAAMAVLAVVVLSVITQHQAEAGSAGVEHRLMSTAGRLAVMAVLVVVALVVVVFPVRLPQQVLAAAAPY